jgi:hypothetical protein
VALVLANKRHPEKQLGRILSLMFDLWKGSKVGKVECLLLIIGAILELCRKYIKGKRGASL